MDFEMKRHGPPSLLESLRVRMRAVNPPMPISLRLRKEQAKRVVPAWIDSARKQARTRVVFSGDDAEYIDNQPKRQG